MQQLPDAKPKFVDCSAIGTVARKAPQLPPPKDFNSVAANAGIAVSGDGMQVRRLSDEGVHELGATWKEIEVYRLYETQPIGRARIRATMTGYELHRTLSAK